jgi:hypothetical protein
LDEKNDQAPGKGLYFRYVMEKQNFRPGKHLKDYPVETPAVTG